MFGLSEFQGDDEKMLQVTPAEKAIAEAFVAARRAAMPLNAYPGRSRARFLSRGEANGRQAYQR